jgi:hypothetical protein
VVTTFRLWGVNLNATLSSGLGKDEDEYVSVNDVERWSSKAAGDVELNLRRGVDLQREEEEDFFFCSPPEAVSWARPANQATLVGFGQVRPFALFILS